MPSQIFDINCVDPLGRSALIIAVENENLDLIEMLLDVGIKPKVCGLVRSDNTVLCWAGRAAGQHQRGICGWRRGKHNTPSVLYSGSWPCNIER